MKLEALIDKYMVNAIDALGKDVRTNIENMIGLHNSLTAITYSIAAELGRIALFTKDRESILEAVKTINMYKGKTADRVANALGDIAFYGRNKDEFISAVKTISMYKGETAGSVAYKLWEIASESRNKNVISIAYDIIKKVGNGVLNNLDAKDIDVMSKSRLEKLIVDNNSFNAVSIYTRFGGELPLPTKDNINTYENIVSEYISKAYGTNKKLDLNAIYLLFSVKEEARKGLAKLVNESVERNIKEYSISSDGSKPIYIGGEKLTYYSLIAVTGSRDKEKDKEAFDTISSIVGEKTVRKARNSFNSRYKHMIKDIASYVNKGDVGGAISLLASKKDENIDDILAARNYKEINIKNKNLIKAVESNNPLDYRGDVQIACVYLPDSREGGIYEYCNDYYSKDKGKGFVLARYGIDGKTLGSAICYMEDNKFLVDSVEGHKVVRKPQIFDAIYKDLIYRAKEKGANMIIFGNAGMNETPKMFMRYIRENGRNFGLKKQRIKMKLDTDGYLETEENEMGYILKLD